jgi:hypothetical protein
MGKGEYALESLVAGVETDVWVKLTDVASGEIELGLTLHHKKKEASDDEDF